MFKIILIAFFFTFSALAREAISGNRYKLLSGVRKNKESQTFWDKKFSGDDYLYGKAPAKFLSENYTYIPFAAKVLDVGMGEGRNAVFLARKGYNITGVDISAVAVRKARKLANEYGIRINTVVSSMEDFNSEGELYDAILVFYYVDRKLNKKLVEWLKPGGILIYESHTKRQKTIAGNEKYEDKYLLREGELLTMFPDLRILNYEEPLHMKEFTSSIILQKPKR
ncbi:bifunctional 2-polyprenyl-6-hydroxyphenol methylase/3-demethylubiquinol 3-O-methyltransferase UbiG [Halobacteriovorax sp. HLS]|uniref:class I SAM-dependent methyltransferase n=1 Tax=Halobacteriovorax sp. HLS TaxID=2234000 RepID=UPI000FDA6734|nr:class I SAM-dependent methyltransferase [Halobacteriovorax sp. HLS]